jgi:hypothetical protein
MMNVILSCGIHKREMGSVHYCQELENHWGDILCYLPGILAEKLCIGWDCVSISQTGMRLENLLGTSALANWTFPILDFARDSS